MSLRDVILTLQYCLETFEATCQCGRCDPCTKGQDDIRSAISALEELERPQCDAVGDRSACSAE
jgi:NADH:ubiquinone oxidoreductase subunit F (NADH-binding)